MDHKSKQAAASIDITPCVCVYIYVVHGAELMKHVASCTSCQFPKVALICTA